MTLLTRPRRFSKTLTMSMAEKFFSIEHADKGPVQRILSDESIPGAGKHRGVTVHSPH